jgi:branched-chain amino acid transport system permease protein
VRPRELAAIGAGVVLIALFHWLLPHVLDAYLLRVVLDVGIAVTMAVSLNLVNGVTGQFSIGHAGFMALGGYVAASVTVLLPRALGFATAGAALAAGYGFYAYALFSVALVAGGLAAAGAGWVVGLPSLRLRGDYLAIVTLGFGEIIRVTLLNINAVGGARGFTGIPDLAGFFPIALVALVTVLVSKRLVGSTHGRALLAVREDEIAAEAVGVPVARYKVKAFVMSSFFAGVGGALFAHHQAYLNPASFTWVESIKYVAMVVLGGQGSISGVLVAAVMLAVMPEALRFVKDYFDALRQTYAAGGSPVPALVQFLAEKDLRMVLYSLLLVLLMLVRPQGILGTREFWSWKSTAPPARPRKAGA